MNIFLKKATSTFLIIFLSVSFVFPAFPQKANAGASAVVEVGANVAVNILSQVSNAISAAADAITSEAILSIEIKEYILDGIVPFMREALIKSLTSSIINWINSGFEGDPMFVTDLEGFLLDVANETSSKFISDLGATDLCSPFRPQIMLQMSSRSTYMDRAECTVLDVIDNYEAFQDDFEYGGWNAFVSILEPQNNYYGSMYMATEENAERLSLAIQINQTKLDWGQGFLSWEECITYGDDGECWESSIVTPGSIIYGQLNEVMPTGLRNLELADEINEIIGALLTQLMKEALGSGGGLYGASHSSRGSVPLTDTLTTGNADADELKENISEQIYRDVRNEEDFLYIKEDSLAAVNVAERKLEDAQACYQAKADAGITLYGTFPTTWGEPVTLSLTPADAQREVASIQTILNEQVYPLNNNRNGRLTLDIQDAEENIDIMEDLEYDLNNTSNISRLNKILEEYQSFRTSGYIHSFKDILDAKYERDGRPGVDDGIVGNMNTLKLEAEQNERDCRTYNLTQEDLNQEAG
ncbi:hypothetical protein ACFLY0_02365 [Patescibacteria group bacterium]